MASHSSSFGTQGAGARRRDAPDEYDGASRRARTRERDEEDEKSWKRGTESTSSYRVEDRFADEEDDEDALVSHARVGMHDAAGDADEGERRPDARFEDEDDDDAPPEAAASSAARAAVPGVAAPTVAAAPPAMTFDDEGADMEALQAVMGFSSFTSTKGKHCEDNDKTAARGAVSRVLKRQYRQYMNRKGGFNRPLQPQAPITRK